MQFSKEVMIDHERSSEICFTSLTFILHISMKKISTNILVGTTLVSGNGKLVIGTRVP